MRSLSPFRLLFAIAVFAGIFVAMDATAVADEPVKVLIVDGQNNHNWKKTTPVLKAALESCGRFTVDVATSGDDLASFAPEFSKYHVVVSNYNGKPWSESTAESFDKFVKEGGGLVCIHAADNSFPKWQAYNRMIGLGGWGGRNEQSGPYVYVNEEGEVVRDNSKGRGGSHGPQHAFPVIVRDAEHPITKGLPKVWMHAKDELYTHLRGPAENMKVLATAFAKDGKGGRGVHEPSLMVIDYGKGRVFHSTQGHADYSMECVGFVATLQRGTEWAATGKVTIPVPEDFPSPDAVSVWKAKEPAAAN